MCLGQVDGTIQHCLKFGTTCTVVSRKSTYGQGTLQVCQRGGGYSFECLAFNHKCTPSRVYSIFMPSKKINGQTNCSMEPPAASKLSPDGTQHSEQHNIHDRENGVAHGVQNVL